MIIAFISLVVAVISFNFFMYSYQVNGLNRLVVSMPLSLYETAIDMFEINEETGPYFDKEYLEDNLTSFFDYHIYKYTDNYSLNFYYYNIEDHSIDMDDECQAVEVTVTADIILYQQYVKTMHYEIRRTKWMQQRQSIIQKNHF